LELARLIIKKVKKKNYCLIKAGLALDGAPLFLFWPRELA